jgi:hypothetical protein
MYSRPTLMLEATPSVCAADLEALGAVIALQRIKLLAVLLE